MGYTNELVRLLRPLGYYNFDEGSFSLGQLQALGAALDELDAHEQRLQRESLVATAQEEGLEKMLALFRSRPVTQSAEAIREAIAAFLQIGGDSFTLDALQNCLTACGTKCHLEQTDTPGQVVVSFPLVMGVPEGFSQVKGIIEDILPCHLEIIYFLRYCTWSETKKYGLRWLDVGNMTWDEWRHYTEDF